MSYADAFEEISAADTPDVTELPNYDASVEVTCESASAVDTADGGAPVDGVSGTMDSVSSHNAALESVPDTQSSSTRSVDI